MVKLLAVDSPEARADAAWLAGVRASVTPEGDCVRLGAALIEAALRAEREHAKPDGAEREANAWLRALWAAREIAPGATRKEARRMVVKTEVPSLVRVEAVHALAAGGPQDTATLRNLLVDTDTAVRAAAASALVGAVPSVLELRASPFDPVLLGQIAGDAGNASAALVSTEGRRVFLGRALGRQERQELVDLATLARTGTGQDRLDAFAALGRGGGTTAMEVLSAVAFAKGRETADVKKAAYRALRRAQRMESQKEARS